MEAARPIKSKNPHSMVEVKDLKSGEVTAVALRPVVSNAPQLHPTCLGSGIDKDHPDAPTRPVDDRHAPMTRLNRVATLGGQRSFRRAWTVEWCGSKLEELP
jgi:hypothetical protein